MTNRERIPIRRMGSNAVHVADIPARLLYKGISFGTPYVGVEQPVAALCGAVLRGRLVRMDAGQVLSCRACSRVGVEGTR